MLHICAIVMLALSTVINICSLAYIVKHKEMNIEKYHYVLLSVLIVISALFTVILIIMPR